MAKTNEAPRAIEAEPETPVLFRIDRRKGYIGDGVTAVFPCDAADYVGELMTCYAHVGQHSGCSFGWYFRTKAATPEEYASLKTELESLGYRLKVYQRKQPWMRRARLAQLAKIKAASRV